MEKTWQNERDHDLKKMKSNVYKYKHKDLYNIIFLSENRKKKI